jgi:hypothetical protein
MKLALAVILSVSSCLCWCGNLTGVSTKKGNTPAYIPVLGPTDSSGIWVAHWNSDSSLKGFKDEKGNVKIKPRFMGFTSAHKFEHIIAAMEKSNGYQGYYLTKSGKIVGRDSLYTFDNATDCENEGFIRFRDKATEKVGLLNKNGVVAIPAIYNELSMVSNGVLTGLIGATKIPDEHTGCNHYTYKGGKNVLIDTTNNVLIENLNLKYELNFYSLLKTSQPVSNPVRVNFKSENGEYISFIDYQKEFEQWLRSTLLNNLTIEDLLASSYSKVTFNSRENDNQESKETFINTNFKLLKKHFQLSDSKGGSYEVFNEGLSAFIHYTSGFEKYFNNCGESNYAKYPVKILVINYNDGKDTQQDRFDFLRTDEGYKLITVSLATDELVSSLKNNKLK